MSKQFKIPDGLPIKEIGQRILAQDNRMTQHPMFCVQIKRRDVGYDAAWSDNVCWHDSFEETIYDDDADLTPARRAELEADDDWSKFGYVDRWETVMVAFTQVGCEQYLELNGHNDRSCAHNGEVRIYVESFNRCPEMIAIREHLIAHAKCLTPTPAKGEGREG